MQCELDSTNKKSGQVPALLETSGWREEKGGQMTPRPRWCFLCGQELMQGARRMHHKSWWDGLCCWWIRRRY